jgi:hypothetical protein
VTVRQAIERSAPGDTIDIGHGTWVLGKVEIKHPLLLRGSTEPTFPGVDGAPTINDLLGEWPNPVKSITTVQGYLQVAPHLGVGFYAGRIEEIPAAGQFGTWNALVLSAIRFETLPPPPPRGRKARRRRAREDSARGWGRNTSTTGWASTAPAASIGKDTMGHSGVAEAVANLLGRPTPRMPIGYHVTRSLDEAGAERSAAFTPNGHDGGPL